MMTAALFAALTAVGAMIPIPVGPVPFTMQTFFVLLSGMVLGPAWGAVSQLVYLLLGLAGLPIFAGFSGGLGIVFSPTFGYLLGFPLAAAAAGRITARGGGKLRGLLLGGACGVIVYSATGVAYAAVIFQTVMEMSGAQAQAAAAGLALFLPADAVKAAVAALVGRRLLTIINTIFLGKRAV